MPRYIDADKLCEALMTRWKTADKNGEKLISEVMADVVTPIIAGTPTADVVEVMEEKEIGYHECSDALLKMWMDNVLTDKEYDRIMNKLNMKWKGENRCGVNTTRRRS